MNIVLQAGAPAAVADLATRGFGIAILTQSMAAMHASRLKALLISDLNTPAGLATSCVVEVLQELMGGKFGRGLQRS